MIPHEVNDPRHIPAGRARKKLVEERPDEKQPGDFPEAHAQVQHLEKQLPAEDPQKLAGPGGGEGGDHPSPVRRLEGIPDRGAPVWLVEKPIQQAHRNQDL